MNKSSSSASSTSPPFTTLPPPPKSTVSTTRLTASVIPLDYDYSIMSPSSLLQLGQNTSANTTRSTRPLTAASSRMDIDVYTTDQYSSLFGDPVQPPAALVSEPAEFISPSMFRASTSNEFNGSSEEESGFGQTVTLDNTGRLFSNVPYTSLLRQRSSTASADHNFDALSTAMPRLRPPNIQILPNSSGGSSSEPRDSPNYALLNPQDISQRQNLYDLEESADVTELSETVTINDANGVREYTAASRRLSNFGAGFVDDIETFDSPPLPNETQMTDELKRQFSNETYSCADWFRPSMHEFTEFTKMPKLRPSSKNVMSIKRDEMPTQHSPVAAMINDSNGSSSGGEERLLNATQTLIEPTVPLDILAPRRPPEPSSAVLCDLESSTLQRRRSSIGSTGTIFSPSPPAAPPPPAPLEKELQTTPNELEEIRSLKREMSPVIIRDSIVTGGDYKVDQIRLHKKTSFTIISDRSPQSSRAQTPTMNTQKQTKSYTDQESPAPTPSSNITPRHPIPKPRHHLSQPHQNFVKRKSLTSMPLRLPQLIPPQFPSDDSPRPSVQFDMSGRYSPSKIPQKGILHYRDSLSSSQETPLPQQGTPTPPPVPMRRGSLLPTTTSYEDERKMRSYEALPLITDPYRTAIPRLNRSSFDLRPEASNMPPGALPRPLKRNPNPTRNQRGLLRVINSAESISRIPRSNWTFSADDLAFDRKPSLTELRLQMRRRSSSTSPSRRSSTLTASDRRSSNLSSVTTSDFSFRRPSLTNLQASRDRRKSIFSSTIASTTPKRRKSIVSAASGKQKRVSRSKIAKPTTLSPIIGTPNKDSSSPQSPAHVINYGTLLNASEFPSDSNSRRDSISRIPVLSGANSRSNSRLSSYGEPRVPSRMSSPLKEFTSQLPLSGLTSRTESRSPSRATMRNDSRPGSRADLHTVPSRSTSRASTRPISRGAPSRSSSRPSSRIEQMRNSVVSRPNSQLEQARDIANSRSNSRLSLPSRSPIERVTSVSPNAGRKHTSVIPNRRKSVSLSPQSSRKLISSRRTQSPTLKKRVAASSKPLERRRSRSRIPTRAQSDLSGRMRSRSPAKSKGAGDLKRAASARKPATTSGKKQPTSAKKALASVRKLESSVKRSTSSANKSSTAATKKQTSSAQKNTTSLKREPTNLQRKTVATKRNGSAVVAGAKAAPKRETSAIDLKKKTETDTKQLKKQTSAKELSKTSESKAATATPGKSGVANSRGSGVEDVVAEQSESTAPSSATIAATATATGVLVGAMKRQPSTMSLIRMGSRLSLLSKKRPDSSLSRHITEESEESSHPSSEQAASRDSNSQLHKVSSSGQLITPDGLPAVILEKSQKTLENVKKSVTVATDEIQRTIHENLTDLKNLEQDVSRISDGATSPTPSVTTVLENKVASRGGTSGGDDKSPQPPTQPIEASVSVVNANESATERVSASTAISVLPEVDCESANFQNFALGAEDNQTGVGASSEVAYGKEVGIAAGALTDEPSTSSGVDGIAKQRRSPDGQGSTTGSGGKRTGSRELLDVPDEETPKGCCRCCTRFCMPCRRARCSHCCRRNKGKHKDAADYAEDRPVLSATSSTTTTNLDVVDETTGKKQKNGCWQKMNCFKKKHKKESNEISEQRKHMEAGAQSVSTMTTPKQSKCGACLRKIFCCRSANKVETAKADDPNLEKGKCCACLPCFKKKSTVPAVSAWQDPEAPVTQTNADSTVLAAATAGSDGGCCKRFWRRICCCCCRKKAPPVPAGSRRTSIRPPPPAEDTRRKLHVDLVEYTSKMKGAIPVLPLYLAWFCLICNIVVPGLGTIFSGIFCICVGIPRFSQYDSAKARLGSFIINTIVGTAQFFCVLFCFVGWGWSIWWGTIMLKCAKKLKKIRKVERLEMEEEERQAAAAAATVKVVPTNTEPTAAEAKKT